MTIDSEAIDTFYERLMSCEAAKSIAKGEALVNE